jgi:hypothetical protein
MGSLFLVLSSSVLVLFLASLEVQNRGLCDSWQYWCLLVLAAPGPGRLSSNA